MRVALVVFRREIAGYFTTPLAYVFISVYLLLAGWLTFSAGGLLDDNSASLRSFFFWHPWLYVFIVPALSMRLWAEERRAGTIELLFTLPITMTQAVVGKFLAAWLFTGIALALTFPVWLTVNFLGSPDNGIIVAAYVGSFLMAGGYLAIGSCISALTRNQVIAFVVSLFLCLGFTLAGFPDVLDWFHGWAPALVVDAVAAMSFWTHFEAIQKGVLDLRDIVFFLSLMAFWLFANALAIDLRKAD